MSWLVAQIWPWMLVASVLGAVVTTALTTTRVAVERWEELPAEAPEPPAAATPDPAPVEEAEEPAPQPTSPFPVLPGALEERPWEAEELWSKPARLPQRAGDTRRASTDEWSEAASSWRTWAEDAVAGRTTATGAADGGSFAGDRDVARRQLEPVPPVALDDDPFPYARPVEAPGYPPPVFPGPGADHGHSSPRSPGGAHGERRTA